MVGAFIGKASLKLKNSLFKGSEPGHDAQAHAEPICALPLKKPLGLSRLAKRGYRGGTPAQVGRGYRGGTPAQVGWGDDFMKTPPICLSDRGLNHAKNT